VLSVKTLRKSWDAFRLHDVSFDVPEGEYFALLGASGAGKTLILECLAGLTMPDAGRVWLDGQDITSAPVQGRRFGLVYQDQALFPHMTVRRNVLYGVRRVQAGARRRRVAETARDLARELGIEHLLHRYPATLSGGEAQRVALARALAISPRCLLLDEPLSSLDNAARTELRALLRRLNRDGHTVVHVTHDYEEALSLASRVAIVEGGTVAQAGTPAEVFHHPRSEFVARFVGIRNFFRGTLEEASPGAGGLRTFRSNGCEFHVLADATPGQGFLIVGSQDITLSNARPESSARNCFCGRIIDAAPAPVGLEVSVDIGTELTAVITTQSWESLRLELGKQVWVSFKASAARFVEAHP